LDIELKPAFLGGVMSLTSNSPPASNPAKAMYLPKDLQRSSAFFGIPITHPADFPANTLHAQRLLILIYLKEKGMQNKQPLLRAVSRLFWKSYWGDGEYFDISKVENLKQILNNHLKELQSIDNTINSEEINSMFAHINDNEVKQVLKQTTEEVVNLGTFGLPFLYFPNSFFPPSSSDPLCFFGSDRYELIAHCLKKQWKGPHPEKSHSRL